MALLLTIIGRLVDGLPLAASMPSDEQGNRNIQEYQSQAKNLFKKLNERSPAKCSIESEPYIFHYSLDIHNGVCYLVMTEKTFSKRQAFSYLDDIQKEFALQYGGYVPTARRPYCFIEFDTYMQKAKKNFSDGRSGRNRNLGRLNDELQGVQKIMIQNIDDVLQRGENLSVLDDKAGQLRFQSEKYKKDAKFLNLRTVYAKYAVIGVLCLVFLIYIRYWWL
ncbi:vesicle-trafficking protein SEC22b-like [Clytia hemisphaerica]|uniref:Vesicle-trafficking protein SEC22b n=1 Tax=Clytia hemisphaerica TaxID=252671 RepID=A0A7M5V091_9CNID|eukprot:TCONS_00021096-protein